MGLFNNILDYAVIAVVVAISIILTFSVVNGFNSRIQATNSSVVTQEAKDASTNGLNSIKTFDIMFALLFFGFLGASVFLARSSFSSTNTTLFVVIGVLGMIFFGFIGMIIENVWDRFSVNASVSGFMSSFPFTNFFMNNFVVFLIGFVFIVGLAFVTSDSGGLG